MKITKEFIINKCMRLDRIQEDIQDMVTSSITIVGYWGSYDKIKLELSRVEDIATFHLIKYSQGLITSCFTVYGPTIDEIISALEKSDMNI